ncbi:type II secretion system protein [Erysipelothrix sp. HDW6C]|uniref:PulJ/GspJ family protein n=1 Tax=Erysipelothrix sp. HDW6C TaxID=2714930 RepID=UPI0014081DFD|nr:type II secretion system protein [Erysipelothrix sp. HDW6C]QIK70152.1 type II secretion system protein [Erysipelothrix sp. HDW6C]
MSHSDGNVVNDGGDNLESYKRGFTLLETLVAVAIIPVLMLLIYSILMTMTRTVVPQIEQHDIFQRQLQQLINRSGCVIYAGDKLMLYYDNEVFEIMMRDNRIVKSPGYEILLEEVTVFEAKSEIIRYCLKERCYEF